MSGAIPITLVGENLGRRHLFLNSLVNEACKRNEEFDTIKNLREQSPIDRLFKIDLASKIKNVNYIIENLKDDDMLNVSRALKSTWLIENEDIINPQYLEKKMYPEMITTAVTKMEHWLHLNLKDATRCFEFYQHYHDKNFNLAIKFLMKCSNESIISEFPKIVDKMKPHIFKVLCEKCSNIAKMFFDSIATDAKIKSLYLDKQIEYFNVLKYLLKIDANLVLNIYEKYFNINQFKNFSPSATKYIISYHKIRFSQKPELYTAYFLHLPTMAECLTSEECKELVLKLARAKYLTALNWFNYKKVEPLIKRLIPEERAQFKKKIFVAKDLGEEHETWPYEIPAAPTLEPSEFSTIFNDFQPDPESYRRTRNFAKKRCIKKKRGGDFDNYDLVEMCDSLCVVKPVTMLDRLFDEFRFVSFRQTLYDLRKRIAAESSPQNREFMMLVLVSKSGGRPDTVAALLELLAQHSNEPPNVRAAVIRSLVKRAQVWRLPEDTWNQLLKFGRDLGLDGNPAVADCGEGLHAVVIRHILLLGKCPPEIQRAFFTKYSNLYNYNLSATEKLSITSLIPTMILNEIKEKENVREAVYWVEILIDTLKAYKIKLDSQPEAINIICQLSVKDQSEMSSILINLFNSNIARRKLFRYTFNLIKTDDSYVNALKHDPTIIDLNEFVEYYGNSFKNHTEKLFKKVSIYFNEENGLSSKLLEKFKDRKYIKNIGRPLAMLLGKELESYLCELDRVKSKESQVFTASIKANAHTARPLLNIDTFGWEKAGVKLIANKILICRFHDIDKNVEKVLKTKKTTRLALALAKRTKYETDILIRAASIRPKVAMIHGLKLIKANDQVDIKVWEVIKPIIQSYNIMSDKVAYLTKNLAEIRKIALKIRPEYSTVIYKLFVNKSLAQAMPPLCHIELLITEINEQDIENILQQFLEKVFVLPKLPNEYFEIRFTRLYTRILIKFLFLCKNKETQRYRWDKFGKPLFAQMEQIFKSRDHKKIFSELLDEIFLSLKYNKVFLDTQYVSALPVMENILIWVQELFPLEQHFGKYTKLHLSMLYFKAVRRGVSLYPHIFSHERKLRKEGVEIVGKIFGIYVAKEVRSLRDKYFDTIVELYGKALNSYMEEYNYCALSSELLVSLLKGILEESTGLECLVAVFVMAQNYGTLNSEHSKEIKEMINGLTEPQVQIIAFSDVLAR